MSKEVIIPDIVKHYVSVMRDKNQPQWVRDNNRRTIEDIVEYLQRELRKI